MNSKELQALWIRYSRQRGIRPVDSQAPLQEHEVRELVTAIQRYPSLLGELADDRAVDSMLQQMARQQRDDDVFVSACLERLESKSAVVDDVDDDTVSTAPADDRGAEAANEKVMLAEVPEVRRRRQTPLKAVAVVTAIGICILISVWSIYGWRPDAQQNTSANSNRTDQSESGSGPLTVDDQTPPDPNPQRGALNVAADELDQRLDESSDELPNLPLESSPNPFRKVPRVAVSDSSMNENKPEEVDSPEPPPAYVTVDAAEDIQWVKAPESPRIAESRLVLESGHAELTFDNGSKIEVLGPADIEITSPDSIYIQRGHILAKIPPDLGEFAIETPSSRLSGTSETELQLQVQGRGASEILMNRGLAQLQCWNSPDQQDRLVLDSSGNNQAVIQNPNLNTMTPAICMVRGIDGAFEGLVNINGQSIRSENPQRFSQLLDQAARGWSSAPEEFLQQWQELARRMQDSVSGSFQIDGTESNIESMDEFFRFSQRFLENMPQGQFQGSITINGQEQKFDSMAEFLRAQAGFFGPLAPQDLPNNPNTPAETRAFDGVVNVNGREIRFTSPERFRKAWQGR